MWTLSTVSAVATAVNAHSAAVTTPPAQLDRLALFGFLAAFGTLVCYVNRNVSRSFVGALAVCLAATATYAFLQGAWPIGLIQTAWFIATARRWCNRTQRYGRGQAPWMRVSAPTTTTAFETDSRVHRLFGSN